MYKFLYIEELVHLWNKSHQPYDTEENEKETKKNEQTKLHEKW